MGVGHAVRCLALGQELLRRCALVEVFGSLEIPWVAREYADAGIAVRPASGVQDARPTHAVIDGYAISPALGEGLRNNGVRVSAMVDDQFGADQIADLYVDQNFGARPHMGGPDGSVALAGPAYALFRDDVLAARRSDIPVEPAPLLARAPSVLAVFGGTDPYGAGDVLVPMLIDADAPMRLTVLCPDPERAARLRTLPHGPHQSIEIVPAVPDLAARAAAADLAVSAAGSTVWELLTIGTPTAVVCVVDNQEPGYRATTEAGLVVGAGRLPRLLAQDAVERASGVKALSALLTDSSLQRRLREQGMAQFDGRGRERVADELLRH